MLVNQGAELQRIRDTEMRCCRKILLISYKDHVTNEEVCAKKFYQHFQTNYYTSVIQGKKTLFQIDYILITLTLTHSFIMRKEEAPVCVTCDTVIIVKHILIE